MDDRLTALDATFLELEEADTSAHMHIGGVMLFEPRAGGAPSPAQVCAHMEGRMEHLPRYAKRLSSPTTGGLSWPSWEVDERFELAAHIRRAALPAPGTREDLLEWAGAYFSERLDRSRPLWELVIVEGLADGRWALVSKTHHALVDGVGAVDVGNVILDTEPAEDAPGTPAEQAPPSPPAPGIPNGGSPLASVAAGAWGLAKLPVRAGRAGADLVGSGVGVALHPSRAVDGLKRSRAMVDLLLRDEMVAAPRSSLNVPIGGHRRITVTSIPLGEIKRVGRGLGGTVNDVVLTIAAGGLRDLLLSRGEDPPSAGLRAMVPVNLRTAGEHLALGNKITTLFVHLPVAEPDPLRRFQLQAGEAEALKAGHQGVGSRTLIDFTAHAPPIIHSFLARSMYATRLFNLTITNVPGPPVKLYALGSELSEIWPIVPLAADHAVGLAVISYDGTVYFCINADTDATPDLDILAAGIEGAFDELVEAERETG